MIKLHYTLLIMFVKNVCKSILTFFESRYPLNNQPVKVSVSCVIIGENNFKKCIQMFRIRSVVAERSSGVVRMWVRIPAWPIAALVSLEQDT